MGLHNYFKLLYRLSCPLLCLLLLLIFSADSDARQQPGLPEFSHPGGFYSEPFDLQINPASAGDVIYYTLDGSVPDPQNAFTGMPVQVTDRTPESNRLVTIRTTLQTQYNRYRWHEPSGNVDKALTVRAIAVSPDGSESATVTHTYRIGEPGRYTLPVVSLVTDEGHFFDHETGIYVHGRYTNYSRRGSEWERPLHVEYFDRAGRRVLAQDAGMRIHGGWSRNAAMKTLRLYARTDYGVNRFYFPFFGDDSGAGYNRLLLRNSGNDFGFTMFRDALAQMLVRHMNLDVQQFEPSVVFLNGEYWGVHNIRERYDRHFLERVHSISGDRIDLLTYIHQTGEIEVIEGSESAYLEMKNYATTNDLSDDQHYAYIADRMDIDNFINFYIAQIYYGNHDWPHNNLDFWRYQTEPQGGDPHPADGRFRWLLYDLDMSFGLTFAAEVTDHTMPTIEHVIRDHWSTDLFRSLMKNVSFRQDFHNRFLLHLQTTFKPGRVTEHIEQFREMYEPEMERHIARWNNHSSLSVWHSDIDDMLSFAEQRPAYLKGEMLKHFGLPQTVNINLALPDPVQGSVYVQGYRFDSATPGLNPAGDDAVPVELFAGYPVILRAVADPGYVHSGWLINGELRSGSEISIFPAEGKNVQPVFTGDDRILLHYWHFNDVENLMRPVVSTGEASITTTYNPGTDYSFGSGAGFQGENARGSETPGRHLVINRASGSALLLNLPTAGYVQPVLSYEMAGQAEAEMAGQAGAMQKIISYSINGIQFEAFDTVSISAGIPRVHTFDLSGIDGAAGNPDFRIRIDFTSGTGNGGGHNGDVRIDNIAFEGTADGTSGRLPGLQAYTGIIRTVANSGPGETDLTEILDIDPASSVTFSVESAGGNTDQEVTIQGNMLVIDAETPGESQISLTATSTESGPDGPSVTWDFRVLTHPDPFLLHSEPFHFDYLSPELEVNSFPGHILFVQSDETDPVLQTPMPYAYHIPGHEYHPDDAEMTGFPFALTRRSRINALMEDGVGFINTGRDRDVGALIISLDTRQTEFAVLSFTASTIQRNSRHYAIRLRYRTSVDEPFIDVLQDGNPVEYLRGHSDGDTQEFSGITLPDEMYGEPFVQLKWKYYHTGGRDTQHSGARDMLSLNNIRIASDTVSIDEENGETPAATRLLPNYPNPFNSLTNIRYHLSEPGHVVLDVFDITGRRVVNLLNAEQTGGTHTAVFDATALASGVYIVRMQSGGITDSGMIMYLK